MCLKICSIKKRGDTWILYDTDGEEIRVPSESGYFSSALNRRYRNKRKSIIANDDISCVWFLIGNKNGSSKWIQVGRTKNLTNLLSNDVKEDIKDLYFGKGMYGELKEYYDELSFYEIDVERYIKGDEKLRSIMGKMPRNKYLRYAYLVNCAAYLEGKLACQYDVEKYHSSTLDGFYNLYFKEMKNDKLYKSN